MANYATFIDHAGVHHKATVLSPALLLITLHAAMLRTLEIAAGARLGTGRLCFDAAKAQARRRKFNPSQRGRIRFLICCAV